MIKFESVWIMGTLRCYGVSKYRRVDGQIPNPSFPDELPCREVLFRNEFQDEDWLVLEKQGIRKQRY
jgi:hypothetical protein